MSVHILVSGSLWKNPEQRSSSKTGKIFTTASIRTSSADNTPADFWNLLVFSETVQAELMRLTEGEKLAVQGSCKIELFNGKISRTVFVDAILPLRAPPREKKPPKAAKAPTSQDLAAQSIIPPSGESSTDKAASSFYDDDIPF
jgi:single-stranded DNA-binding protein